MQKKHKNILLVSVFALILVVMGILPTAYPFFAKPQNRDYTWSEGFSEDYMGYVSYIKEGQYGRNTVIVRSARKDIQSPTTIHLLYIFIGKISNIFNISAPIAYHLARMFVGFGYILSVFFLYKFLFKDSKKALFTTILSFLTGSLSWYQWGSDGLIYKIFGYFEFSTDMTARALSRPHYELSGILFLLLIVLFLKKHSIKKHNYLFLAFFAFALSLIHTPIALVFVFTVGIFFLIQCIRRRISIIFFLKTLVIAVGAGIGGFLSFYSSKQYPWNLTYLIPGTFSFYKTYQYIIFAGPMLWIGFPGYIYSLIKKKKKSNTLFMFIWLSVQLMLFLFLYRVLKMDRIRFIQTLFHMSMTYGAVLFLSIVIKKKKLFYSIITFFIVLGLPSYFHDFYYKMKHTNTNFRDYSLLLFPSRNIMKAFNFLDCCTAKESTVLARYEAANNIQIYSHNTVIGHRQGWSLEQIQYQEKIWNKFFLGMMSKQEIIDFLRENKIDYVYGGYQERISGVFTKNPDIFKSVYSNSEVTIYKVNVDY